MCMLIWLVFGIIFYIIYQPLATIIDCRLLEYRVIYLYITIYSLSVALSAVLCAVWSTSLNLGTRVCFIKLQLSCRDRAITTAQGSPEMLNGTALSYLDPYSIAIASYPCLRCSSFVKMVRACMGSRLPHVIMRASIYMTNLQ